MEGALLFVKDYNISTNSSIMPTSNIQTESGGIVTTSAMKNAYVHNKDAYVIFTFLKSSASNNIKLNYEK